MATCAPTKPGSPPERGMRALATHAERALNVSLLKSLFEHGASWTQIGAAFPEWPLASLKQHCHRAGWHRGSAFDKSLLQHLYEGGAPWSEIEAAFPGQTRSALESRCHRSGWHAPAVHRTSSRRPSQPDKAVDVTWTPSAQCFFLLLIHGDELVRERWVTYPRDTLIEWALAEVRATMALKKPGAGGFRS
ncbi:MAG: hypothetical protein ACYCYO_20280 [Bacilli bacterium]